MIFMMSVLFIPDLYLDVISKQMPSHHIMNGNGFIHRTINVMECGERKLASV